jgi:Ran GTPase-activating protein (RanGAP) involved in mRNA processing and transport
MNSTTPSPRKNNQSSISSSESIEEFCSSEEVDSDTDSTEENVLPVVKSISSPNIEIKKTKNNDLCAKFYRRLSFGHALNDLSKEDIRVLANFLDNTPEIDLKKLDIYNSDIGDDGAKLLATIIKKRTTITTISFARCKIGDEGAKALAEAIQTNADCRINKFALETNTVGIEGMSTIAEMLTNNTSITELNLCCNNITNKGVEILAEGIKSNHSITSIFLNGNSIDSDGVKPLANLIRTNTTLISLELCGNKITAEGAIYLADAIKANPYTNLAKLNLRNNNIGELKDKKNNYTNVGYAALADAMEVNSSIVEFDLSDNESNKQSKLDKEIIKQQCGLNDQRTLIEKNITAALDLLTTHPTPIDGNATSHPDVNGVIAKNLFILDKSDKLISAKIRKNPDIVFNKYT